MSIREFTMPDGRLSTGGLNYRLLGTLGMIGAPMLFLEMVVRSFMNEPEKLDTQFIGATGVFYMGGWIAVAIAMRRLRATGTSRASAVVFAIQITGLVLASLYSLHELFRMDYEQTKWIFTIIDIAYPFSHLFMFAVGVLVWRARVFDGLARIAPFGVALMLPLFFGLSAFAGMQAGSVISTGLAATALFIIARRVIGAKNFLSLD